MPLTGTMHGPKHYDFGLGEEFLAYSQFPEAGAGNVHLDLVLEKHPAFIALQFNFDGWLRLICDRCAEEYDQPVKGSFQYILKYGSEMHEETDEVMIIPADLHEFDVFQLVYEYLMLLVPMRKVHLPDATGAPACNPDVISLLERMSSGNNPDPRWGALQSLMNPPED